MRRLRVIPLLAALALASAHVWVAPGAAQGADAEVLTNESVVMMTKAGLGPEVIASKIRSSQTDFDVTAGELVRLKQEGVDDSVIAAMLEAEESAAAGGTDGAAGGAPDPGGATGPGGPPTRLRRAQPAADPAAAAHPPFPSESGIYYAPGPTGPESELVMLEPSVYTQSKETGAWKQAITYGIAKKRFKVVLPGAHARLTVETRRPVFYFFFDVPNAGLSSSGSAWGPATSANEFILARMERRKSSRELEVGDESQYTGRSYGVPSKASQPFDYEKLAPGVYRVTTKADLKDGEYCFLYGGSLAASGAGGGPKLFDFGVKAAPPAKKP